MNGLQKLIEIMNKKVKILKETKYRKIGKQRSRCHQLFLPGAGSLFYQNAAEIGDYRRKQDQYHIFCIP